WGRWQKRKYRLEWEATGVVGQIENASNDPASPSGQILIRQFGAVLQGAVQPTSRWTVATELGIASGDRAPGFGNHPGRGYGVPGSIDGAQYGSGDRDFRNFRFNPAYRVDLVLWREILGGVTDAWYLKPSVDYQLIDGLVLKAALVYSQAIYAESTPSTRHKALGIEADFGVHYKSDDGFVAWVDYGLLQPLDGFNGGGDVSRAHAIRTGLGVKF
ncbi:MAG: TIGR04551 family protein, partial [Anaeromyxobacteraceae bacterium]